MMILHSMDQDLAELQKDNAISVPQPTSSTQAASMSASTDVAEKEVGVISGSSKSQAEAESSDSDLVNKQQPEIAPKFPTPEVSDRNTVAIDPAPVFQAPPFSAPSFPTPEVSDNDNSVITQTTEPEIEVPRPPKLNAANNVPSRSVDGLDNTTSSSFVDDSDAPPIPPTFLRSANLSAVSNNNNEVVDSEASEEQQSASDNDLSNVGANVDQEFSEKDVLYSSDKVSSGNKKKIIIGILVIVLLSGAIYLGYVGKYKNKSNEPNNPIVVPEPSLDPEPEPQPEPDPEPEPDPDYLDKLARDSVRSNRVEYFTKLLQQYVAKNKIPVSSVYLRLNEQNEISALLLKLMKASGDNESDLLDPLYPSFYFAYKSEDGVAFEFTAQLEVYQDKLELCDAFALEENNKCIYRFKSEYLTSH